MFSVPEVHPLFGSTHAVGDHVRETVESEASINIGSRAGDEHAPINAKDMLEHLTLGDRLKEADNIEIPNLPDTQHFRKRKANVRAAVASASRNPQAAFLWIRDVETTADNNILSESAGLSTLDSKLAAALAKVVIGALGRVIDVEKEKLAQVGRMMKGREILYILYTHLKVSETEGHILDFQDILAVKMHSDDLQGFFFDEWELTLTGMQKQPEEEYLETMFRSQI